MNEVEMQPDPIDYGEWKSGVNTAGTLSAVNGFVGQSWYGNCKQCRSCYASVRWI